MKETANEEWENSSERFEKVIERKGKRAQKQEEVGRKEKNCL